MNSEKSAVKDLSALPKTIKQTLDLKIAELANFPNMANIKKLTHYEPAYRLRVGDYRVLFDVVDNQKIIIGRVLHRKESYKNRKYHNLTHLKHQ